MNRNRWDELARQWLSGELCPANGMEEWTRLAASEAWRIGQLLPAGVTTLLEVGCGVGRLTPHLAGIFPEVFAIDQSLVMLAITSGRCRELANVHTQLAGTEPACDVALVWGNLYDEDWGDEEAAQHGESLVSKHHLTLIQTSRVYLVGYWQTRTVKHGKDWLLVHA